MTTPGSTPANPLPADTKVPERKVVSGAISSGAVIGIVIALAQFLYGRADLVSFLPDWLEPIVLAIIAAVATYGAGYAAKHQWRTAGPSGSSTTIG